MKSKQYGIKQRLKISNAYSELAGLPLIEIDPSANQPKRFNFNWIALDQQNRRPSVNNTNG